MKKIKSYVTNPEFLNKTYLDFNSDIARELDAIVNFVVHSKEIYEPSMSPIIGDGLPSLHLEDIDRLRNNLDKYIGSKNNATFHLSQDIFAEIFSNADVDANLILHTFSSKGADFVLHNIYSSDELDVVFDNLSPAMFVPDAYTYKRPKDFFILLFSEDLGSNINPIIALANQVGAKIHFIIQQVKKERRDESILEKISNANHIKLKNINFTAKFVDSINDSLVKNLKTNEDSPYWTVFQHTFLLQDLKSKNLDIDIFDLLTDSEHPTIIV